VRLFERFKNNNLKNETNNVIDNQEALESYDFPDDQIVSFDAEILNTNSLDAIAKFKHNLSILVKQAKEIGKIDKFILIREDNFFPYGWKWNVSSKNTCYEKVNFALSSALREHYALEQVGALKYFNGILMPISKEVLNDALSKVDKDIGTVFMPNRFRATKHFTVNTPLDVTGDYNSVETNRDFIIMDSIDSFLESEYAYSVAYHDAYLDVSHEGLKISQDAIVLIEKKRYEKIKNSDLFKELSERKVIVYEGDRAIAIDMVLSSMGVLPSKVGTKYLEYDDEIRGILDKSIEELANTNQLQYDKSHAGKDGHFSSYYDDINYDFQDSLNDLILFLKNRFPEFKELITASSINNVSSSYEVVSKIGTSELINAIADYNSMYQDNFKNRSYDYQQDRLKISDDVHKIFSTTVQLINKYYMDEKIFLEKNDELEHSILRFFQGDTVEEQLTMAGKIIKLFQAEKDSSLEEMFEEDGNQDSNFYTSSKK